MRTVWDVNVLAFFFLISFLRVSPEFLWGYNLVIVVLLKIIFWVQHLENQCLSSLTAELLLISTVTNELFGEKIGKSNFFKLWDTWVFIFRFGLWTVTVLFSLWYFFYNLIQQKTRPLLMVIIYLHLYNGTDFYFGGPVGWSCRIHQLHLWRGVRHPQWVS